MVNNVFGGLGLRLRLWAPSFLCMMLASSCGNVCDSDRVTPACYSVPVDCQNAGDEMAPSDFGRSYVDSYDPVDQLERGSGIMDLAWWIDGKPHYRQVQLSYQSIAVFSHAEDGRPIWTLAARATCSQPIEVLVSFVSTAQSVEEARVLMPGEYDVVAISTDSRSGEQGSSIPIESDPSSEGRTRIRLWTHPSLGIVASFDPTGIAAFGTYFVGEDVFRDDAERQVQLGGGVVAVGELD